MEKKILEAITAFILSSSCTESTIKIYCGFAYVSIDWRDRPICYRFMYNRESESVECTEETKPISEFF